MKKGFTLAEILIVLIIIGVVSVLTVPALVDLYKFRDLTARYQRIYAELSTAFTQAAGSANLSDETITDKYYDYTTEEYVPIDVPGGFYATKYGNFSSVTATEVRKARQDLFIEYLGARKCQQNWGSATADIVNCFSKQYDAVKDPTNSRSKLYVENIDRSTLFSDGITGRTPWGASFLVYTAYNCTPDCPIRHVQTTKIIDEDGKYSTKSEIIPYSHDTEPNVWATFIFVDTNGPKGPNVTGYDAFIFQVAEDGSLTDVVAPDGKIVGADSCGKPGTNDSALNNYTGLRGCVSRVEKNGGRVKKFTDAEINGG